MAINKTFVPHTELKAQDLNELVSQANAADAAERARAEADLAAEVLARDAAIATEQARAEAEEAKKPNKVELYGRNNSEPLPMDATYYYGGLPTHSVAGTAYDSDNEVYTDYIGICINHEDDSGFEPQHHDVMVFVKSSSNYIYSETFNTSEASGYLEEHVARALGSVNATSSYSGLMSAEDKRMFDDVVTEVFPLTVAVASSNAGTYEVGDAQHSVTPQIVLSITRKGADVASSAQTTSSQGTVQSDHKTITGSALTSGTTTFQISVTQGGQTVNAPNQVFDFMNYMYYGEVSTKPAGATAVATLCENGSLGKQLSRATTKSSTNLAANKYYVFAVKGSVNLVCRHAGTDAIVTGCTTGTATIQRVNQSGSDLYSYIIVEKSASAWSFKITNS